MLWRVPPPSSSRPVLGHDRASSLAAPSFPGTVTTGILSLPWGTGAHRLLLAWPDEGDWAGSLDCPAGAHIKEAFPTKALPHSVALPPGVGGARAPELGGPASLGRNLGSQGGPRNQPATGTFFFSPLGHL